LALGLPEKYFVTLWGALPVNAQERVTLIAMSISFQANNRQLLLAAFLLLIPDTFFWYSSLGFDWSNLYESFTFQNSDVYLTLSAAIYLLLFFSLFVEGDRVWKPYFMVSANIVGIYRYVSLADTWNKDGKSGKTILNNLFIKFDDQLPLQLFSTLSMIAIIGLSLSEFKKVISSAKTLLNSSFGISGFSVWTILGSVIILFSPISIAFSEFIFLKEDAAYRSQQYFEDGFQWSQAFVWILGVIAILLKLLITIVIITLLLTAINIWSKELGQLWQALKDFRVNKYITRLITGYIYTYFFIATVIIMALATPIGIFATYGATYGTEIEPVLAVFILIGVLLGIFITMAILLVIRLLVEISVALIHIAQNTSR
jgi:hypothetical protein